MHGRRRIRTVQRTYVSELQSGITEGLHRERIDLLAQRRRDELDQRSLRTGFPALVELRQYSQLRDLERERVELDFRQPGRKSVIVRKRARAAARLVEIGRA